MIDDGFDDMIFFVSRAIFFSRLVDGLFNIRPRYIPYYSRLRKIRTQPGMRGETDVRVRVRGRILKVRLFKF